MTANRRALANPPGGTLMWLIVGLECLTFAIVFTMIAAFRAGQPAAFALGQAALSRPLAFGLTLALVTSGLCAAEAVHALRERRPQAARRFIAVALALGTGFVALKVRDAVLHLRQGHALGASDFWDAYVLSTGFHFIHVVVGLGLLGFAWLALRRRVADVETVAAVALFWHLCDLAWFFLFALFYSRV